MIDLHLHSSYSDGRQSPAEVVRRAAEAGLEVIALADHDVVGGTDEALEAGRLFGVEVIPAIELTVRWGRRVVHLLGYGIDHHHPGLLSRLVDAERAMAHHVATLCADLEAEGQPVVLDALHRVHSRYPTGTSVVLALTRERRLGQLRNPWSLLRRAAQQPVTASIEDGIQLIHAAGGVAVLAHPGKITRGRSLLEPDDLAPLATAGLDGLECWSVSHAPETQTHFLRAASELDLIVTGGSDSHGRTNGVRVGNGKVLGELLVPLRARIAERGSV